MALSDAVAFATAAWTLDEASGSRADSVGSNTLTDNNTVGSATGKFSNAADFESANSEYLSITDNADVSCGDILFMFRCWVQLESKPGSIMEIASKFGDSTGTNREFQLRWENSTDRFQFIVGDGSGFTTATADNFGAPSTGTWYLIHAWHNSTTNEIGISVNAGTANTVAHSTGVLNGTDPFLIGAIGLGGTPSLHWDGLIDDFVFLKDYVLDATERTADYNSGTGVAFADWDAGGGAISGSSAVVFDSSANLTGKGSLAGSAASSFTPSGSITGNGSLAGSSAVTFGSSATLTAKGSVAGTAAVAFGSAAELTGTGTLAGTSAATFTPTGTLAGTGSLAGSSSVVFDSAATLSSVGDGSIAGTSSASFGSSAALTGKGSIAGTAANTFGSSATIRGIGTLAGTSAALFTPEGVLSAITMSGTSSVMFGSSATLTGRGALAGSSAVLFGSAAAIRDANAAPASQSFLPAFAAGFGWS